MLTNHSSYSLTAVSIVRLTFLAGFGKTPDDFSKAIAFPLVTST